jgi:hypothetical protein
LHELVAVEDCAVEDYLFHVSVEDVSFALLANDSWHGGWRFGVGGANGIAVDCERSLLGWGGGGRLLAQGGRNEASRKSHKESREKKCEASVIARAHSSRCEHGR